MIDAISVDFLPHQQPSHFVLIPGGERGAMRRALRTLSTGITATTIARRVATQQQDQQEADPNSTKPSARRTSSRVENDFRGSRRKPAASPHAFQSQFDVEFSRHIVLNQLQEPFHSHFKWFNTEARGDYSLTLNPGFTESNLKSGHVLSFGKDWISQTWLHQKVLASCYFLTRRSAAVFPSISFRAEGGPPFRIPSNPSNLDTALNFIPARLGFESTKRVESDLLAKLLPFEISGAETIGNSKPQNNLSEHVSELVAEMSADGSSGPKFVFTASPGTFYRILNGQICFNECKELIYVFFDNTPNWGHWTNPDIGA
ncbi:hypothetical protein K438DRAFT_1775418 [Mycena galopus ATCC 62051]|nr:hypothetical protein K438DRAFT_1775418 [Mycena galopus ATCC 62051]